MPETKTTIITPKKFQGKDAATENALCTNAEGHNFAACNNFALLSYICSALMLSCVSALYGCSMEGTYQILRSILLNAVSSSWSSGHANFHTAAP